jgi:hypothetical protein
MPQLSNPKAISHRELVALAERLMSEMEDERFLPAYDEALAADNDWPLVSLCGELLQVIWRRTRRAVMEARTAADAAGQSDSSRAA